MAGKGIGDELRCERLRRNLTLEEVSQRTKIPVRSLDAIEAEAFARLPGVLFARNFVRLYALELDLDPAPLVALLPRVDIDSAPMPDPPIRPVRYGWNPRWKATIATLLWVVTASASGLGAWYYFNHHGAHISTVSAAPPPHFIAPAQQPPQASPSATPSIATTPITTAASADNSAEAFDSSRPVQVILTAHDVVWLQVSADGRTAFVGTLHPNEKRVVAADAQVSVKTGNAGGLDISLNGKPLDPIGPTGQTRTVRLTAEGPQFGPQNPPASSPL